MHKRYTLFASTKILLEYEETFIGFWSNEVSENLTGLLQYRANVERITVNFNWRLINKDEDDNKFVDCFVAVNADYLISNDTAITQLKGTRFPPLNILIVEEFSQLLFEA